MMSVYFYDEFLNGVVPWLTLLLYGRKPFGKDFINICLYVIFFLKNTFDWLIAVYNYIIVQKVYWEHN